MTVLTIRRAEEGDAALVLQLLHELAVFEKLDTPEFFRLTEAIVARDFIGSAARVAADLGYWGGEAAGICVWYRTYTTFRAAPGLFLEDIFVRPAFRGFGIGRSFFVHLARVAAAEGADRIDWSVLDWNEKAIGFYRAMGAGPYEGWTNYRLRGPAIAALADER
ncbi:MAG: GNAT family N-acetyltransferase [Alphaproteobacteria bacterium]